jgi:hypothetical protein
MCLSRLRGTFVAFGLTWALVESVNSLRTAEARNYRIRTRRSDEDRTLLACRGWAAAAVSCRHSLLQIKARASKKAIEVTQISQTHKLADGRGHYSIGRIRAAAEWRGANAPGGQADRELIRETREYGADAIVGLEFHIDDVKRADIEGPALQRVAVTGIAVKFTEAA